MSLTHLSHITCSIDSPESLLKCNLFYTNLGFKIIREIPYQETFLHLFPSQETVGEGVTLRLVVDHHVNTDGCIQVYSVNLLDPIEIYLKSNGIKYQKHVAPYVQDGIEIITSDPCGNKIAFSTKPLPFSQPLVKTSTPSTSHLSSDKKTTISNIKNHLKKRIGVLTSGGDSQGMNAAVRAITRFALQKDCIPFAIYEGYQGLVDGGDKIKQLGWEDVRGFLSMGGTVIGTARCLEFRERSGRLKAVYNMIKNGIDALIVIGGDGSLTGADLLRSEWTGLLQELVDTGKLLQDEIQEYKNHLTIVGMVGSIDNDMSMTDITIGAMSSLHRICEALDSLSSTASSHQRAFVVEVMGRHCGWLALMAGIAAGADWVFLPERPPPLDIAKYNDWESEMCETVHQYRKMGSRKTIIIVCEGAIDRHLKPIKADQVKKVLEERLGLDTRVTTLGHVQRGGTPCASDRYLATLQGVEAVQAVLKSTPESIAPMIGISENTITTVPLMEAVQLTHDVAQAIARKDFARAMELRDPHFAAAYDTYIGTTLITGPSVVKIPENQRLNIGIMHIGAPSGGMNAATRIAGRLCINRGHTPIGIRNGFQGLLKDEVRPLTWEEMVGWQVRGGSELGTNRDHPQPLPTGPSISPKGLGTFLELGQIAFHLQKNNIQALLMIGGFEAYTSLLTLTHARPMYPAFCIPMVHLPATVSNNVPGTDHSVGSDTALNAIMEACDRIKLSANASRKRVFVVEVQGGNCGYLASISGLVTGAAKAYIPEVGISIDLLQQDIRHLVRRYTEEDRRGIPNEGRVILRTESTTPEIYNTETISGILRAEGKGIFDSRTAILGHLQQGGIPSPTDRIRATRLAKRCIDWIQKSAIEAREALQLANPHAKAHKNAEVYTRNPKHSCVIGVRGASIIFTPVEDLMEEVDLKGRRNKTEWWMKVNDLTRILAKYDYRELADEVEQDEE